MKHTNSQASRKNTAGAKPGEGKKDGKGGPAKPSYKMDFIKKDNYDVMTGKLNITEIGELRLKYVLSCTEGIFKNRFLYITTHKDGEVLGSG